MQYALKELLELMGEPNVVAMYLCEGFQPTFEFRAVPRDPIWGASFVLNAEGPPLSSDTVRRLADELGIPSSSNSGCQGVSDWVFRLESREFDVLAFAKGTSLMVIVRVVDPPLQQLQPVAT
jgi:hypothetical protein